MLSLFKPIERRLQESMDQYESDPHEALAFKITKLWLRKGNPTEAFKWAKHAREAFPTSRFAERQYQRVRARKTNSSVREARTLAKKNPTLDNFIRLSEMLRIAGRWKEAFEAAKRSEERNADHWKVQLAFGKLWFDRFSESKSQEDGWNAVEFLDRSRCNNPRNYSTLILLGIALSRLGSLEDALGVVDEALELQPQDPRALSLRSKILKSGVAPRSRERSSGPVRNSTSSPTRAASGAPLAASVLAIPGAVGFFEFDERGKILERDVRPADSFDFDVPANIFERMAAVCVLDTRRIGFGDFRSCSLTGNGWALSYNVGGGRPVLAFFEGSISGELAEAELEAVLTGASVST
jgi:tetratricopeptide (TPR) repeat protein